MQNMPYNHGFFEIYAYSDMNIPAKVCFSPDVLNPNSDIIFLNHWHPDTEIWLPLSGKAQITIGDTDYIVSPGDAVIINSNELHSGIRLSKNVDYIFAVFSPYFFSADESQNIFPCFKNFIANDQYIQNIFSMLKSEIIRNDKYSKTAKTGLLYELTAHLMRNYQTSKKEVSNIISSKRLVKIKEATDFIAKNASSKIKVSDVAKAVNISESRLAHLFKEEMGQTVLECITTHRIYMALRLLETTNLNVSQIAHMSGFENLNYFIKRFKSIYKVTPSRLRKNMQQKKEP